MLKNVSKLSINLQILLDIVDASLSKEDESKYPWLKYLWIFALYFVGFLMWGKLFSWGRAALDYHDWAHISIPRLDMVRDALISGTLPYHAADTASLLNITDRFFVLPDVITTPQMLLLLVLDLQPFVFFDIIFHYTIGMVGLYWIREKKNLSLFSFTILFFLFNFNGYIISQYSTGHYHRIGYFFFPFVYILLFNFVENGGNWRWVTAFASILFYNVLAGGQHHFVWLILFLLPFGLISWSHLRWVIVAVFFSGILSSVRLLPPVLALETFSKRGGNFDFVVGFPSLGHYLQSMIIPTVPVESLIKPYILNIYSENVWEFNFFIGILGTAFILYFGIWSWFKYYLKEYIAYVIPVFFLFFLSMGGNYWLVRATEIPLFGSERVTSRMVGVSMTFLIVLAVIFFQKYLNLRKYRYLERIAGGIFLLFLVSDLWSNLKLWQINSYAGYFLPEAMNITSISIANHADPIYYRALGIGLGLTIISLLFLLFMSFRENQTMKRNTRA